MQNKTSKRIKIFLSCTLLGVLVIISGFLFLRLRGSVVVKPVLEANQAELVTGQVTAYRQDDEAWADEMLGDSRFTMKSSGCLVTCIASAVSMETGGGVTPDELNRIFSENHVYDSEGNIQWAAVDKIDGYSAAVFPEVSETEIYQCLASGHYPVVRVRMHGLGSFHYVLVVGINDGDYLCMDPLKDGLTKLSQYWNRIYAVRMVYFSEI